MQKNTYTNIDGINGTKELDLGSTKPKAIRQQQKILNSAPNKKENLITLTKHVAKTEIKEENTV
jgi:hypothetical protein